MPISIKSPYRFKERICAFGAEGVGKSSLTLDVLRYDLTAHAWVVDIDYSQAYERLIATDYPDVEERVHIFTIDPDWDQMTAALDEIASKADPANDWLTIDPATKTWQMVQSWYSDRVHGENIEEHLINLRADNQAARNAAKGDAKKEEEAKKGYFKDTVEDMTWPLINKVYEQQFYKRLHQWRGHFVLVCESDALRRDASEEEKTSYGFIGQKPKGQKSIPYVAATNVYLDHPKREEWRMTTTKDRGRKLVERMKIESFALDYLVDVGGWEKGVVKAGKKGETDGRG